MVYTVTCHRLLPEHVVPIQWLTCRTPDEKMSHFVFSIVFAAWDQMVNSLKIQKCDDIVEKNIFG